MGTGRIEIESGFASETGLRTRNEDYGAVFVSDENGERAIIAAIADGIGGNPGGREAAEIAVQTFIEAMSAARQGLAEAARAALAAANARIFETSLMHPRLYGMGTTFSALVLSGDQCLSVHIGDSRIYQLREGELARLTDDHNLHAEGLPNVLTRSLGTREDSDADTAAQELRLGDRFLLCTDGVTGVLTDKQIAGILRSHPVAAAAANRLAEAALAAGGTDNATALVLDIVQKP